MDNVSILHTEQRNQNTVGIDKMSTLEMLQCINNEDQTVAIAVKAALPQIAKAVDAIVPKAAKGGRIVYMGAGTSGRLGYMDASECPPTYGVAPDRVTCLMAGGRDAVFAPAEKKEDSPDLAREDLIRFGLTPLDTVVAIAASGRTPYCIGALDYARSISAGAVSVSCNPNAVMSAHADVSIEVDTGAEVIMGSTRMKAGTAQKMVLNMISTSVMVQLGRTWDNLMVCLKCNNEKIGNRSLRLFTEATGCRDTSAVEEALASAGGRIDAAVLMHMTGRDAETVAAVLREEENIHTAQKKLSE